MQSKALDVITAHPIEYLTALPVGGWRLATEFDMVAGQLGRAFSVYYLALYGLAVAGWVRAIRSNPLFAWTALAVLLYFSVALLTLISAGFGGTRQAAPFLPLVCVLAVWPLCLRRSQPTTGSLQGVPAAKPEE